MTKAILALLKKLLVPGGTTKVKRARQQVEIYLENRKDHIMKKYQDYIQECHHVRGPKCHVNDMKTYARGLLKEEDEEYQKRIEIMQEEEKHHFAKLRKASAGNLVANPTTPEEYDE